MTAVMICPTLTVDKNLILDHVVDLSNTDSLQQLLNNCCVDFKKKGSEHY